jgi:NhaP-type Na+/H+ or K+/H+ antiporter
MNDAMSILLFHAVTSIEVSYTSDVSSLMVVPLLIQVLYLCITAAGVGLGSGLLVAILLKSIPSLQMNSVRQTAILMLGGYFSFSVSEAMDLSGILTVFFCGLTLSHYAWHSLGTEAQVASKITSDTISMIAEAYCFAAIGLSVHEFNTGQFCIGFISGMIGVLMIARAVSVYGFCLFRYIASAGSFKMPIAEQNVLYFGGLVRGAISWAQVMQVNDSHQSIMITTTLGVIIFTIVIFGAVMPFFTRHLTPEDEEEGSKFTKKTRNEPIKTCNGNGYSELSTRSLSDSDHKVNQEMHSEPNLENITPEQDVKEPDRVHQAWAWFDDKFMKPVFGGSTVRQGSLNYSSNSNHSAGNTRVGRRESRTRTYSGITRIIPESYGSTT